MPKVVTTIEKVTVPKEKLDEYKEAFDMFDKDGSGSISVDEIFSIMKNFGNPLTKAEIKKMISELDTDGTGDLDFEEFISFMQMTEEVIDDDEAILRAFKAFDKDKNGYLSNTEFRYILTQLGDKFTDAEVDQIFKESDLDNDGRLNYQEFIEFWKKQ